MAILSGNFDLKLEHFISYQSGGDAWDHPNVPLADHVTQEHKNDFSALQMRHTDLARGDIVF